ncbi:Hypothetical predicted protein, partial [Olea europaea subsp. europaea]
KRHQEVRRESQAGAAGSEARGIHARGGREEATPLRGAHAEADRASFVLSPTGPAAASQSQPNFNFGFALRHFDAPLYHPEVHETRMDQAESAQVAGSPQQQADDRRPGFAYASTVVHSEVAAEQSYQPERLTGAGATGGEVLQRAASESVPGTREQQTPTAVGVQHAAEIVKRDEPAATTSALAYATRLRPLDGGNVRTVSDDELSMEDSEQIGFLPNGTQTQVARARLPDRSKKLSSIFKARHAHHQEAEGAAGGSGSSGAAARIRRPVPMNAKRQPTSSSPGGSGRSTGAADAVEPNPQVSASLNEASGGNSAPGEDQRTQAAQAEAHAQPASPRSATKKFGANLRQVPPEVKPEEFTPVVAAKKRPLFVEPTRKQTEQLSTSATSSTTVAPPAERQTQDTNEQRAPQAVIVDATNGLAASNQLPSGGANRDLMEKIMRIQQELASKAAAAKLPQIPTPRAPSSTSTQAPVTSTASEPVRVAEPSTTTTTTTTSTTTTSTSTTTPEPPTTTTSTTITTTPAPTTTQRPTTTTTSTTTTAPETATTEASGVKSGERLTIISDNELAAREQTPQVGDPPAGEPPAGNLLTGPLVRMVSSSLEQDDFMTSMTRDMMMSFDSARAVVMSDSSVRLADQKSSAQAAQAAGLPGTTTTTTTTSTTSAPTTTSSTTQAPQDSSTASSRPLELSTRLGPTTTRAPQLISTETVSFASTTPTSSTTTTTTTTTSSPSVPAQGPQTTSEQPPSTTSTTTAKPGQRLRTTAQPARFGRLVIKRGDKVVARYNASDSIPDSMIPVSGASGEIIMPDMPRLGMRRARKRMGQTSTSTSTTTERPASVEQVVAQRNATAPSAPVEQQVTGSTRAPSSAVPSDSASATPTNRTQERNETLSASASEWTSSTTRNQTKRRSLLRGARSPLHSESESESDELLVSEESSPADVILTSTPARRRSVTAPSQVAAPRANSTGGNEPASQVGNRFGARSSSWSSRVRENIGRQVVAAAAVARAEAPRPNLTKKYDPEEDLKKLVEKIERIQFESSAGERVRNSRTGGLDANQDDQDVPRRFKSTRQANVQIDVLPLVGEKSGQIPSAKNASAPQTVISEPARVPSRTEVGLEQETSNATQIATVAIQNGANLAQALNKSRSVSQSSSISFTLPVSANIESQWSKLRPVNLTSTNRTSEQPLLSTLLTRLTNESRTEARKEQASPLAIDKLDIRMDSHGHIHVRNNQSITVHVDIEPPRLGNQTLAPQKRISSRDTSAVLSPHFGRDDIQRVRQSGPISGPTWKSTASMAANDEATASLRRKPRMLCIEVESNDSDLQRQNKDNALKFRSPQITPDVVQ